MIVKSGENYELFKAQLHSHYWAASSVFEGEISSLANEAWDYYYGKLPKAAVTGGSTYISRDVFEAVNGTVQDLLNVFTSGEEYAKICSDIGDVGATEYINKVITRENDGYRIFNDIFKESCVTRASYIKYYWEDSIETVEEEFGFNMGMTRDELEAYLESRKMSPSDDTPRVLFEVEDEYGLLSGTLEYSVNKSGIKLEYVPFEELIFDAYENHKLSTASYVCHRVSKTKEELLEMGFSEKLLEEAGYGFEKLYTSAYENARNAGRIPQMYAEASTADKQHKYTLCEHYMRTSLLSPEKKIKLYQVFSVGSNNILEINEVDRIPFEVCSPMPIPGGVYGESVVDIVKDVQDVKSAIMRGYIDNIHNANHGSVTAMKGQYNKRDLMDNRPRRIVEIEVPGAVQPFPYNPLPQGIDNLLEHMEQAKELRTGVTRLGAGLNSDVFKNDNAFATVNQAMTAAQNRLKMICRNVAENFMKDLMLGIYELARKNDKRPTVVSNFMGSQMVVPYTNWPEKVNVRVEVAIGEGEKQQYAQKLIQAFSLLTQAPMLAGSAFTTQNAHYLAYNAMKYMGIHDLPMAITPMSQVQPPQPDPLAQRAKELEIAKVEAEVMERQANAADKQAKAQLEMQRLMFEQQRAADEFKLKVQDYMSKGQREADRTQKENFEAQTKLLKEKLDASMKTSDLVAKQEMEADKLMLEQRKLDLEERELALKEAELRLKAREVQMKAQVEVSKLSVQKETSEKQMELSREQSMRQVGMQQRQLESSERQAEKATEAPMKPINEKSDNNDKKDVAKSEE